MTVRTLYVVRHGQTEWNVATRMQGRMDSPLTEMGRIQADLHGRTLSKQGGIEAVIASPLGRTRDTADLLNVHLSVPVSYEDALVERDCGAWSGLTIAEIEAAYPDDWRARGIDPYYHRPPGGENLKDMEARVSGFIDALLKRSEGTLALVTHGVMSRVILKRLLDLEPAAAAAVRHPNGLFYRLEIGDPARRACAHFLDGQGPRPGLLHKYESETIAGPTGRAPRTTPRERGEQQ